MGGWKKALWTFTMFIIPLFGALMYLIVRGSDMQDRGYREAAEQDAALKEYIRDAAAGNVAPRSADQLSKLASLRDQGIINAEEFDREKDKILG